MLFSSMSAEKVLKACSMRGKMDWIFPSFRNASFGSQALHYISTLISKDLCINHISLFVLMAQKCKSSHSSSRRASPIICKVNRDPRLFLRLDVFHLNLQCNLFTCWEEKTKPLILVMLDWASRDQSSISYSATIRISGELLLVIPCEIFKSPWREANLSCHRTWWLNLLVRILPLSPLSLQHEQCSDE